MTTPATPDPVQIRLQLPDRGINVPAGQLFVLAAGPSHDVYAGIDSTFSLTLGWPAKR